jgi:DNA-directed RNA polymerase subunit omega
MARITVEDCLQKVNNRFTLIHMAAKRVRQLRKGAEPTIPSKNKDIVVSLREIASGNIRKIERAEENPLIDNPTTGLLEEPELEKLEKTPEKKEVEKDEVEETTEKKEVEKDEVEETTEKKKAKKDEVEEG